MHNLEVPGSSPGPATKLALDRFDEKLAWFITENLKIVTDFTLCARDFL